MNTQTVRSRSPTSQQSDENTESLPLWSSHLNGAHRELLAELHHRTGRDLERLSSHSCRLLTKGSSALPRHLHTYSQWTDRWSTALDRRSGGYWWVRELFPVASRQAGLRGMGGTTTAPVITTGHFPEGLGCHTSRSGCLKTVTCALPWSPMGGKRTQRSRAGRRQRTARSHLFSQWHENRGHQPTKQTGDDVRGWRKAKVWNGHHKV